MNKFFLVSLVSLLGISVLNLATANAEPVSIDQKIEDVRRLLRDEQAICDWCTYKGDTRSAAQIKADEAAHKADILALRARLKELRSQKAEQEALLAAPRPANAVDYALAQANQVDEKKFMLRLPACVKVDQDSANRLAATENGIDAQKQLKQPLDEEFNAALTSAREVFNQLRGALAPDAPAGQLKPRPGISAAEWSDLLAKEKAAKARFVTAFFAASHQEEIIVGMVKQYEEIVQKISKKTPKSAGCNPAPIQATPANQYESLIASLRGVSTPPVDVSYSNYSYDTMKASEVWGTFPSVMYGYGGEFNTPAASSASASGTLPACGPQNSTYPCAF